MARKKIQGITIEIGGDTTKLQTALKGVESKLKDNEVALKDVNKLLKLDPGNTELLTQKQQLLGDSIKATEEKLKTLRDASDQAAQAMVDGDDKAKAQYDALQREIIETEQNMKSLQKEMKDFGSVAAQQLKAAGQKGKEFGDTVTKVGENLTKNVTGPIVAVAAAATAAFNDVDEGMDIIVKKTGATGQALEDLEQRAQNIATTIPTSFATAGAAIGEVNTRFDLTGDELEALALKFIQFADLNDTDVGSSIDSVQAAMAAFGVSTEKAGNVLDILNKAVQDSGTDVNTLTSDLVNNAAALQEMGFRITGATGFLASLSKNGLDSSTVLAGMKKALQNATKQGLTMDQALAKMQKSILNAGSEMEAMQIATDLFGAKSAPAIVKALRDGRLSFDEWANTVRGAGNSVEKTFEATIDPIDEFKTALNELKIVGMELVEAAAPLIKELVEMLKSMFEQLREWWGGLSPYAQETIIKLAAIAAAVGPVLVVVGKLISLFGALLSPAGLVIAAIGALVAGFVHLWNTSEEFRLFWLNLWERIKDIAVKVKDALVKAWKSATETASKLWTGLKDTLVGVWDGIKEKAKSVWEGITNTVKTAIEKIKSFFSFQWELPKIPLPHFTITGKFSLSPPQVPHLSVDWYRKAMENGMIMTSPTVLPAANGSYRGFGDAGPEAVVGVSSLRNMINNAVSSAMQKNIGGGNLTVVMELDGSEFARTTVPYIDSEVQRIGVKLST